MFDNAIVQVLEPVLLAVGRGGEFYRRVA